MNRPRNTRISFLHKTFQKTLKITESELYTLKNYDEHTYHFAMEVPPPPPGGTKINYSYAEALLFV